MGVVVIFSQPPTPGTIEYRPISSQSFLAGCHGNRNWRPIWKLAWWARVSCRRSRMYGIQCQLVQFCRVIPYSTAFFFLPESVSCRGQRIGRSNGKKPEFYREFNHLCSGSWSPYTDCNVFTSFFIISIAIRSICVHHTVPGYIDQNVFGLQRTAKKNGYHFMKNCASTHQPANRNMLDTDHVHIHALPFYFFRSTFNTSKHIFIDFVVLLHWTTQQNKSASLRFGLTWQFLIKKKKEEKAWQSLPSSCG